jgi:large subunit ribosomal protein L25
MSMEIIKLSATRRTESGKGPSNRLRREGKIPAVAYGREIAAVPVAIAPKALLDVLNSEHGQNAVVEMQVEGGDKFTVMVRDYAYHPITRELTHADFVQVSLDKPVDVEVPFHLVGKAKGVAEGGILQQIFRRVPVRCLPAQIPAFVEAEISELAIGDSLKTSNIKVPEGIKIRLPEDQTIVVVAAPEKIVEEEKAPGVPGAPGAPGAAAAPGAPGAPAAAGGAAPAAAGAAPAAPAKPEKKEKK